MGIKTRFIPLILILAFSFPAAFGDEDGIIVTTDKELYETGELLFIMGEIEEKKMPILALRIFDPDGIILIANNVEIDEDNSFYKMISLDSPFYEKSGTYTIQIDYGNLHKETTFDVISFIDEEIIDEEIFDEQITPELTSLETDKPSYTDNDTITISGSVSSPDELTTLVGIYDPFGGPAGFYFGDIDFNNEFTVSFLAKAGVNFKIDGTYTVVAFYGESEKEVSFDFVKSVQPEIIEETKEQPTIVKKETKPESKTAQKETKSESSIIVKEKATETKTSTDEKKLPKVTEKKFIKTDNLTVEDIELGIMLNQITLNCDHDEYIDTISYYDGMGPAMIRLCKYYDAIKFFDKELAENSKNVESLTNKGAALAKLGRFEEAIVYYDYALEVNPSFVPALNNKGNSLSYLGKFDEAMNTYNTAKNLDPYNQILNKNLAKAKTKINQIEKNPPITNVNPAPTIQNTNYDKTEKFEEIKPTNNSKAPDFFEQIENVFSSIGSIFGFK